MVDVVGYQWGWRFSLPRARAWSASRARTASRPCWRCPSDATIRFNLRLARRHPLVLGARVPREARPDPRRGTTPSTSPSPARAPGPGAAPSSAASTTGGWTSRCGPCRGATSRRGSPPALAGHGADHVTAAGTITLATEPPSWTTPDRPPEPTGMLAWLTSTDHKRIGISYMVTAFAFFLVGGLLAVRDAGAAGPARGEPRLDRHATTSCSRCTAASCCSSSSAPSRSGWPTTWCRSRSAPRDMAFPRLNAFSYWLYLGGGITMLSGLRHRRRRGRVRLVRLHAAVGPRPLPRPRRRPVDRRAGAHRVLRASSRPSTSSRRCSACGCPP